MESGDWTFKDALLEHYWISRGFFLSGMVMTLLIPASWILIPALLCIDFFYTDPELPTDPPITPRQLLGEWKSRLNSLYRKYMGMRDVIKKVE